MEELEDLDDDDDDDDDDIFLDDPSSELGGEDDDGDGDEEVEEEEERALCPRSGEGPDPFYDRSPIFSVVGRLVRFREPAGRGN